MIRPHTRASAEAIAMATALFLLLGVWASYTAPAMAQAVKPLGQAGVAAEGAPRVAN